MGTISCTARAYGSARGLPWFEIRQFMSRDQIKLDRNPKCKGSKVQFKK